mgnify:CR=1 FL=1
MTTQHSSRVTRSQAPSRQTVSEELSDTSAQQDSLRIATQEIRRLQEERREQQARFEAELLRRDEELRRLEERIASREDRSQLSLSDNRACGDLSVNRVPNVVSENDFRSKMGFKLKPDVFDGKVPLREFLSQFLLIARANDWDESTKTVALAASLRGKARTVLENIENFDEINFSEIKSKLELLFGEGNLTQNYYSLFTNRRQKFGEDLASFGAELERLSRLAYPECPYAVRDKIACAQFISALSDGFLRRTLQLEGITSLNLAVERAKTVKIIQGENFGKFYKSEKSGFRMAERSGARNGNGNGAQNGNTNNARNGNALYEKKNFSGGKFRNNFPSKGKECWTCGKTGHFRFECPEGKGNEA